MKKAIILIQALAAAVAAFSSCNQFIDGPVNKLTFEVSIKSDDPVSRTSVAADGKTAWVAGDVIAITDGTSTKNVTLAAGNIKPDGSASFSVDLTASGNYQAIYPASALESFGSGTASINMPAAVQDGTVDGVQIMTASSSTTSLSFHNAAALVTFSLADAGIEKIRFRGNGGETLGAVSTVATPTGVITPDSGEIKEITVDVNHSGTNYLARRPADFTAGFTITCLASDKVVGWVPGKTAVNVGRGKILSLGALDARVRPAEDLFGVTFDAAGTTKTADATMSYTTAAGTALLQTWNSGTNYVNHSAKYIYKTSSNQALRLYAGHHLNFNAGTDKIARVDFEMGPWSSNDGSYNDGTAGKIATILESVGSYVWDDARHAHWEGSASAFTIYYHSQVRLSGLVIYYE